MKILSLMKYKVELNVSFFTFKKKIVIIDYK